MRHRTYCQIAAVVFLLFTVYPMVTKLADHRLAHDWAHGVLHLVSALVAAYAGWFARTDVLARYFAWGIAVIYGVLGVIGWFIDGLFLSLPIAIPLGAVDNVFHLALALGAIVAIIYSGRSTRTGDAVAAGSPR